MLLSRLLARNFSSSTRLKGDEYARAGVVDVTGGSDTHVSAIVAGTEDYQVHLTRVGDHAARIAASCSCPYATEQLQPCKHVWATLIIADQQGYLVGNRAITTVTATLDPLDTDDAASGPAVPTPGRTALTLSLIHI